METNDPAKDLPGIWFGPKLNKASYAETAFWQFAQEDGLQQVTAHWQWLSSLFHLQ